MNNHISEEIIEIGGKEYTLFINRQGIVNWERKTKFSEQVESVQKVADEIQKEEENISDEANPFEMYGEYDVFDELDKLKDIYSCFYWIALYTHHKFKQSEANEIFEHAIEEYGLEQLIELANQMIEETNTNKYNANLKNLKALKSKN